MWRIYSNIRIFEYIRHTLTQIQTQTQLKIQTLLFSQIRVTRPCKKKIIYTGWVGKTIRNGVNAPLVPQSPTATLEIGIKRNTGHCTVYLFDLGNGKEFNVSWHKKEQYRTLLFICSMWNGKTVSQPLLRASPHSSLWIKNRDIIHFKLEHNSIERSTSWSLSWFSSISSISSIMGIF